jgi:hypothetical protein
VIVALEEALLNMNPSDVRFFCDYVVAGLLYPDIDDQSIASCHPSNHKLQLVALNATYAK